jgi:hypothetical protein
MNNVGFFHLNKIGNKKDGFLSYFQAELDFGFIVKRIYYIYEVDTKLKRGFHAHKNLKQFMFCPTGNIVVKVDNGFTSQHYILDQPNKGLLLKVGYWREITFTNTNSVLIVAASELYDENDYIRDYNLYLSFIKEGGYNR